MRQDLCSCFRNENCVFPLGAVAAIFRVNGPVVGFVDKDAFFPCVDHRLDRKNHTRDKQHSLTAATDVTDERILVKFDSYAVTAEFFYNTVPVLMRVPADDFTDVA